MPRTALRPPLRVHRRMPVATFQHHIQQQDFCWIASSWIFEVYELCFNQLSAGCSILGKCMQQQCFTISHYTTPLETYNQMKFNYLPTVGCRLRENHQRRPPKLHAAEVKLNTPPPQRLTNAGGGD